MERIELDGFLQYRFLSGLKAAPAGKDLAFLCAQACREESAYRRDLWLLKEGETPLRLTGDGKVSAYLWEDAHTLLFTADRGEGKKEREAGEDYTAFYRLDTRGGEAVKAFRCPFPLRRWPPWAGAAPCCGQTGTCGSPRPTL